ncbi:hypothetical protein HHK36_021255 [Tetracentron sinense]|uniref:BED-type domain-containing protein n=1 Tax=Tetracentron sinense TaxID=13715 RepID=A0A834YPD5_TETSI|nr:hypothetical protein HHK36_021255 [Tetracentron sinense]
MEFRFRADDDRTSTYFSPPLSDAEQALRAGYISDGIGRNDFVRNPIDVREVILRELERERIREEIIAAEIVRKRALEAEVRTELLIERELALQRIEGFSRSDPRVPFMNHSDGSRTRLDERLSFSSRPEVGISEILRFQHLPESRVPEVKSLPVMSKGPVIFVMVKPRDAFWEYMVEISDKRIKCKFCGEVISGTITRAKYHLAKMSNRDVKLCPNVPEAVFASPETVMGEAEMKKQKLTEGSSNTTACNPTGVPKPMYPNLVGTKRKAVTPAAAGANEIPVGSSKKEPQKEWSCALCRVSSTTEEGLNEHLEGKKHQAKEAELRANRRLPVSKKQKRQDLKKKNGESIQKKSNPVDLIKKYKYWCEMCRAGARTEYLMAAHQRGKKHMTLVMELVQNGGVVPAIVNLPEPTSQKATDTNVLSGEGNEETTESMGEEVDE